MRALNLHAAGFLVLSPLVWLTGVQSHNLAAQRKSLVETRRCDGKNLAINVILGGWMNKKWCSVDFKKKIKLRTQMCTDDRRRSQAEHDLNPTDEGWVRRLEENLHPC